MTFRNTPQPQSAPLAARCQTRVRRTVRNRARRAARGTRGAAPHSAVSRAGSAAGAGRALNASAAGSRLWVSRAPGAVRRERHARNFVRTTSRRTRAGGAGRDHRSRGAELASISFPTAVSLTQRDARGTRRAAAQGASPPLPLAGTGGARAQHGARRGGYLTATIVLASRYVPKRYVLAFV